MNIFIKTGDKVRVIVSKNEGKEGTIRKVLASRNRVIVEGVNIVKKHQKSSNSNPSGGVIDTEAAINASNVMLIDPSTNEPTCVDYKFVDGKEIRVVKKPGKTLD